MVVTQGQNLAQVRWIGRRTVSAKGIEVSTPSTEALAEWMAAAQ